MKTTVNLESKDVRVALAKFFGVKTEQIIPNRYSYGVEGLSAEEVSRRIYGPAVRGGQNGSEPGGAS